MLQKYASNREAMVVLQKRIESMNTMIKSALPKDKPCPPKLKEQLAALSRYVPIFVLKPHASQSCLHTDIPTWLQECAKRHCWGGKFARRPRAKEAHEDKEGLDGGISSIACGQDNGGTRWLREDSVMVSG